MEKQPFVRFIKITDRVNGGEGGFEYSQDVAFVCFIERQSIADKNNVPFHAFSGNEFEIV